MVKRKDIVENRKYFRLYDNNKIKLELQDVDGVKVVSRVKQRV